MYYISSHRSHRSHKYVVALCIIESSSYSFRFSFYILFRLQLTSPNPPLSPAPTYTAINRNLYARNLPGCHAQRKHCWLDCERRGRRDKCVCVSVRIFSFPTFFAIFTWILIATLFLPPSNLNRTKWANASNFSGEMREEEKIIFTFALGYARFHPFHPSAVYNDE